MAMLYDDGWSPANVMTERMHAGLVLHMAETSPRSEHVRSYLPWTPESGRLFMHERSGDPQLFKDDLRQVVNLQAREFPTISLDGLHGAGKGAQIAQLRDSLKEQGFTVSTVKYTGYVEEDEMSLYGIDRETDPRLYELMVTEIRKVNELRQNRSGDVNEPSAGEMSWHVLKRQYFYELNKLMGEPKPIMLLDRGPVTRMLKWDDDRKRKLGFYPYTTQYHHPYVNWQLGREMGLTRGDFWVGVPLPTLTVFLFQKKDNLVKNLQGQEREVQRRESNQRNFDTFSGLAWDFDSALRDLGRFTYVTGTQEQVTARVIDQIRLRGII